MTGSLRNLAAVCAWLVCSSVASAEPASAHLAWQRPVQSLCPTAEALQSDVEELSGRKVFSTAAKAEILVRGEVLDLPSGAQARIEAQTAEGVSLGTRNLSAPAGDCAALRRPLSLVLVMLIDRQDELSAPVSSRSPRRLAIGVNAAGISGLLPRFTAGFGALLALELAPRLELHFDAGYWLPVSVQNRAGAGAHFQAASLGTALCPRLWSHGSWFGLGLCGGAQLAALVATPSHLIRASRETRLLAQALAELELSFRLSEKTGLKAGLGPFVSLNRPRFYLTQADGSHQELHRPAPVGVILRLALIISPP